MTDVVAYGILIVCLLLAVYLEMHATGDDGVVEWLSCPSCASENVRATTRAGNESVFVCQDCGEEIRYNE